MDLYRGVFRTQYDGGKRANANCTPTSLAMALNQVSRGTINETGSQIRELVKPVEETNPTSPGWSLPDAVLAARRLKVRIAAVDKGPWSSLVQLRQQRGVLLQGDSDQFPNGCSGAFDGDHCIYLPGGATHSDGRWLIGDPICDAWRWEDPDVVKAYAGKFAGPGLARYAYTDRIPAIALPPDTATEPDMPGLRITDIALEPGWIQVRAIADVQAVNVAVPTKRDTLAPGIRKPTIGKGRLEGDPLGKDDTISRHIVRLLAGTDSDGSQVELAAILAAQVDFEPAAADCDQAVTDTISHIAPAYAALGKAIEEVRPR
jgi:hypothetical protein